MKGEARLSDAERLLGRLTPDQLEERHLQAVRDRERLRIESEEKRREKKSIKTI